MTKLHTSRIIAVTAAVLIGTGATALAADPPARVGRLSDIEGTVSFHTADQTDWSPATLNYPVTTGTSFWTEPNAKAEIQIGAAEVRLDQGTWTDVTALDDNATQIRVNQGVVNVHVHVLPPGGIAVLTPMGQIDLIQPGSYDINAGQPAGDNAPPAQTQLTVLEGSARFDGPRASVDVQAGEAATVGGDPVNVSLAEGNSTPFDDWALTREHRESTPATAQYVPPDMTGYQDLDAYGQWQPAPDYGQVWYPNTVAADWAPYHAGHWAYVAPWGWTWIDDAPWGFAPFHYGRWAFIGNRWGWVPVGPGVVMTARPVYAPALVAFVGGNGFGIDLSIGGPTAAVGWVPLAPYEVYRPWYRVSRTYVTNINVINVRRAQLNTMQLANRGNTVPMPLANRNATVVVTAQAFTHAAPVQRARVDVPREQLARLQVANGRQVRTFQPTPEARAAAARPNAVPAQQANLRAQVAKQPVAYHPLAAPAVRGGSVPQAPGPRFSGLPQRAAPPARQNAAATTAPRPPQPNPPAAPQARPAAVAPAPAPRQPNAVERRPEPAVAAPAPAPQPNAAPRPAPAAAAPAPRPPVQPNAQVRPATPAVAAPAPRPAPAAQPLRPAAQAPQPRPQQPQPRPQMQVQHPVQQTHIQPTPQGWKRGPEPAPAQAHPQAVQPDEKKTR